MKKINPDEIVITLNLTGSNRYEKVSFPIRYGLFSEIETGDYVFQFNLNGEIKYILGKNTFKIGPNEWLKRTQANDWVYYSSGGYNGAIRTVGEHYVPCFNYQTNSVTGGDPFKQGFLDSALSAFSDLEEALCDYRVELNEKQLSTFIKTINNNNLDFLIMRASKFHSITEGVISVLPPDTRHVDYDVIPVNISTGCIYNCAFCSVKTGNIFKKKSEEEIKNQIALLTEFYSEDIKNYNSLFLGQHDALFAGVDLIEYSALTAFQKFKFSSSNLKGPRLFLFGSAESLLKVADKDLKRINRLPFDTFINVGFESFDDHTLCILGKPVAAEKMKQAFQRMLEINKKYPKIEITGNILIGEELPESHYNAFMEEVQKIPMGNFGKGIIYISPFDTVFDRKKLLSRFKIMKHQCRLPAFLYLLQRL